MRSSAVCTRRQRSLSALRLREHDRLRGRLVRFPGRRYHRAHRGRSRLAIRDELHRRFDHHLGKTATLRLQEPERERPFRLPGGPILAPLGFAIANEIILFSGWTIVWKLLVAILIGFILLAISFATTTPERRPSLDWMSAVWLWPYLIGLGLISYLSSFDIKKTSSVPIVGLSGPRNVLTFGWDILAIGVLSVAIYLLAIRVRLPNERVTENVGDLAAEAE
jgi:hypothetical protein